MFYWINGLLMEWWLMIFTYRWLYTRYNNGFFRLNCCFKWYLCNLLIPLQIGEEIWPLVLWIWFHIGCSFMSSVIMISSLFAEAGPAIQVGPYILLWVLCPSDWWIRFGDFMVDIYGYFYCILLNGVVELYCYCY
jgi:hypothetical protein